MSMGDMHRMEFGWPGGITIPTHVLPNTNRDPMKNLGRGDRQWEKFNRRG